MWRHVLYPLLLLLSILVVVHAVMEGRVSNRCMDRITCGTCMEAGGLCGWCVQEDYDGDNYTDDKPRCDLVQNLVSGGCNRTFIINPDSTMEMVKNEKMEASDEDDTPNQLAPQEVNIKLRPNKPYTMTVRFRQAENYPVDLYYVMDLSYSMMDDKAKVAELGQKLAQQMSHITKNVQLGFGSFVDKKISPFISMLPKKLKSPCNGCVSPYGFRNHLKLTNDTVRFKNEVLRANLSGGIDMSEGGFDAIMQAVTCKDEIGWRERSRKMLLLSTDMGFHMAGDGKVGGIVTPNDGNCHLDSEGYYKESPNQDYPSISQLAHKVRAKKVNVIFAITESVKDKYTVLSRLIEGSSVGLLKSDSSNIVELVRDNYKNISSVIMLKVSGNDGVDVSFRTACKGTEVRDGATCKGVGIGEYVDYNVTINVKECPKDRKDWKKSFSIYPVGLTEKLTVHLDLRCECECETAEEPKSDHCSKSGTFKCGACACDKRHHGKHCESDGSEVDSEYGEAACRATNTSAPCSGHGQCLCGTCNCNAITPGNPSERYSGRYCQCDDYSCDHFEGKLCGGPLRGKCDCGVCVCNSGYDGPACQCPSSKETCRAASQLICNGKGECICGKCHCDQNSDYRGPTCEECPTCPGMCNKNKACVECRVFSSGKLTKEYCDANCTHVIIQDSLNVDEETQRMCQFRDKADGCVFYFVYDFSSSSATVFAQRTKECPEPLDIALPVIGTIVCIVVGGLVLLFTWRVVTTIHDRREYAKFKRERQNTKWDTSENPIYKQATSNFKNPTFEGKQ